MCLRCGMPSRTLASMCIMLACYSSVYRACLLAAGALCILSHSLLCKELRRLSGGIRARPTGCGVWRAAHGREGRRPADRPRQRQRAVQLQR